jgi:5-methyltetrahydrofolate--homocysteine methyltransferase
MARTTITEAIAARKVLVSDGAWGTMMQMGGLSPGECPEAWNTEKADTVFEIGKAYIDAGSDIIETNSFGGTSYKLKYYGLEDRVEILNKLAAELSRKAAGEDRWVMGSMGPTGKLTVMGDITEEEYFTAFTEQAKALEAGGADALMIETQMALDEALAAVRAGKEHTSLEIIASFTFEETEKGGFKTMMGVSPARAVTAAVDAGASIIGANCGRGYAGMERVIREFKEARPDVPVLIQTNAGIPKQEDGVDVFPATPEEMAGQVPLWIEAGASIIGGCCGTTEQHIAAIRKAVDEYLR